ncbi:MerR family transcriptional regulator [Geopsychrobacter electrodiphilus]|uniref:MerR family transcriptional regulator n=1 Tax=Geopsychrobacter electrodiphilus TaxID=225196 RepID=UPI00035C260D|nr:MerR family transcriptional regulator [Geopsychrobacter electrodiphilus]
MAVLIPDKIFFKIGEVAELVGVKSHVLRYWESEFKSLKPVKSRSNQRLYRREDIEQALLIKSLLYQQGFTITGARQKLKSSQKLAVPEEHSLVNIESIIERLKKLRDLLKEQAGERLS